MSADTGVRQLEPQDAPQWLTLRQRLWPQYSAALQQREMATIAGDTQRQAVFVAVHGDQIVGFVEVSLHPHAIGCESAPVGYVEGWYVEPEFRRGGVGTRLLAAGEAWATAHGCREMASDTQVDNAVSRAAHRAAGYGEVETLIHFRRLLPESADPH